MKYFFALIIFVFCTLVITQPIVVGNVYATCSPTGSIDVCSLPQTAANKDTIAIILNIVFTIIGAVSVLMVIMAGFKFITSSGKPEEVARAKDTIVYAGVGIIVCAMAVTIVSFIAGFI